MLRVTSTAICGSDLHLYTNAMPGMKVSEDKPCWGAEAGPLWLGRRPAVMGSLHAAWAGVHLR